MAALRDISDCAVRLYAVLLRYGHVSGARMPSRATLARRLRKRSTDTVDRALRELVDLGAVSVPEHTRRIPRRHSGPTARMLAAAAVRVWLRHERSDSSASRMAFESYYETVQAVTVRRDRLDAAIAGDG